MIGLPEEASVLDALALVARLAAIAAGSIAIFFGPVLVAMWFYAWRTRRRQPAVPVVAVQPTATPRPDHPTPLAQCACPFCVAKRAVGGVTPDLVAAVQNGVVLVATGKARAFVASKLLLDGAGVGEVRIAVIEGNLWERVVSPALEADAQARGGA